MVKKELVDSMKEDPNPIKEKPYSVCQIPEEEEKSKSKEK